ncbi:MAG: NAD-dependent epimerase/dehydratase family protein, partial [Candidatus Omnitrophica bacterium]|nr:NAD-dependent epimerase/dehydratase family protein [Candidatus Omnitrophota bacterium]
MILVTGATGFLGKRVCGKLKSEGKEFVQTSLSLGADLREKKQVMDLFEKVTPEYVLNCATFIGGIQFGCKYPVEIFQNNLMMTLNLLDAAKKFKVKRM